MANSSERVSYYIPMVLIYDILSRLPVKSLIRFQTVCKTWYRLIIENTTFIQTHNSIQSTLQRKPSFTAMLLKIDNRIKIHYSDDAFHKQFDFQLPNLFMDGFHVVGICDGLICALEAPDSSEYIIFNPTTRKFRKICPFKLLICKTNVFFVWFGLFENGYKLLKIILTWDTQYDRIIRGELYCLCNDSWQEIEVILRRSLRVSYSRYHLGLNHRPPLILDGTLFWKYEYSTYGLYVAYFDIRKKVFDIIYGPPSISDIRGCELIEVNNKFGLVVNKLGFYIEFWLLNEDMKSFTKRGRVECLTCSGYPPNRNGYTRLLVCSRNGEVILEDAYKNNSMLLLYDLDSNEMKYLHDVDLEWVHRSSGWNSESAFVYNASLTTVD